MPSHSIADRIRACCQVPSMRLYRGTGGEIGVRKKIVVRLMNSPLLSSFRRSPIDRAADYPYALS